MNEFRGKMILKLKSILFNIFSFYKVLQLSDLSQSFLHNMYRSVCRLFHKFLYLFIYSHTRIHTDIHTYIQKFRKRIIK